MRIKELKNTRKVLYAKKKRGLVGCLRGRPPTIFVHTIEPKTQ